MNISTLPLMALVLSAASAGCAWTVNIALYRLWSLVPSDAFSAYQAAHEVYFVPLAALQGVSRLSERSITISAEHCKAKKSRC
jgi:hypothetical protein